MNEISRSALRPLSDSSPSTVVAGFIAMLTGYTSSLVLMFQAGQAAGLSAGQISSWIWALSIGMAICSPAEKIFAPFQRLHSREEYPGTGIGLSIVQQGIERHGGRVEVDSTPGKGSTFRLMLPKRAAGTASLSA